MTPNRAENLNLVLYSVIWQFYAEQKQLQQLLINSELKAKLANFKGPMLFKLRYHSSDNKSQKKLIAFAFISKLIQNWVLLRGEK